MLVLVARRIELAGAESLESGVLTSPQRTATRSAEHLISIAVPSGTGLSQVRSSPTALATRNWARIARLERITLASDRFGPPWRFGHIRNIWRRILPASAFVTSALPRRSRTFPLCQHLSKTGALLI